MLFGLIIRPPPRPIEFPMALSRQLTGQHEPLTEPRGDGPRMGEIS